ncbi:recombinase family protein [Bradyrhizobium sp. 174]|uniref:recombinase family protein n=1 Tax=Bradyrhizobium sp. 174 TaxID=2782645 RepID=UPI001FFB7A1B|nr:recombinase family protein [Bradyrhizobium sp. 174]
MESATAIRASPTRHELGWHEAAIDVIDADLDISGSSAAQRRGFKELVGRVGHKDVGLILSIDVTRLARNYLDWYPLLEICGRRVSDSSAAC